MKESLYQAGTGIIVFCFAIAFLLVYRVEDCAYTVCTEAVIKAQVIGYCSCQDASTVDTGVQP